MRRCAEDADVLVLAGEAKLGQRKSLMFLGAVNSIVLQDPSDPLAAFLDGRSRPIQADDATFAAIGSSAGLLTIFDTFCFDCG